jgi:hypothetical protein
MERWRSELQQAIEEQLQEDNDEFAEFEETLFDGLVNSAQEGDNRSPPRRRFVGSVPGRKVVHRDREAWHHRLYQDYFADNPTFDAGKFRRRFRMRRNVFLRIKAAVAEHDPWFVQKKDCAGHLGLSSLQKCTAAIRILAYGVAADSTDEYCCLGESTAIKSLKRFVIAVRACFESHYLWQPTRADIVKQMAINEQRGFPGMFASIDCMHWCWKNCPVGWQGQFTDKDGEKSIILEAIADQSLWIWHAFFGLPGGNNDLNVLDRSPLVANLLCGHGNDLTFSMNGHDYRRFYLLANSIYLPWSIFLQPIHEPQGEKKEHYSKLQAAARKDVERAFGVLQARFDIVKNPCRLWDMGTIHNIMMGCILIHNMVVEDEMGLNLEADFDQGER